MLFFGIHWIHISIPSGVFCFTSACFCAFFNGNQFVFSRKLSIKNPLPHFDIAVKLFFPIQPLFRFVAFVTPRSRVSLRLRHVLDVENRRNMRLARFCDTRLKNRAHRCVVPRLTRIYMYPVAFFVDFEPAQGFRNTALCRLKCRWYADAVAIVPNKKSQRDAHDCNGINRFKKRTFRRTRIADGTKTDFVAIVRKLRRVAQFRYFAVFLRSQSHTDSPRHLSSRCRNIGRHIICV